LKALLIELPAGVNLDWEGVFDVLPEDAEEERECLAIAQLAWEGAFPWATRVRFSAGWLLLAVVDEQAEVDPSFEVYERFLELGLAGEVGFGSTNDYVAQAQRKADAEFIRQSARKWKFTSSEQVLGLAELLEANEIAV